MGANASKHTVPSWGHVIELEQQLKKEVAWLKVMAEPPDTTRCLTQWIPKEMEQRRERLQAISEAKEKGV